MRVRTGIIGRDADRIVDDDHMDCPVCGIRFDMRFLDQALEHWHDGPEIPNSLNIEQSGQPSGGTADPT